MANFKLKADSREKTGSNKSRQLRSGRNIPGVVYGKDKESLNITVYEVDLDKAYSEAGTSAIIDLEINGKTIPVLIRDIQKHPYKNQYVHVDLLMLDMDETLRVFIPVVLENRNDIRLQPSVLNQQIEEVEIECLPMDIPQTAEYDVIDMQYGDQVLVRDLDIFGNDKLEFHTDPDELVAVLNEPEEEEEEIEETEDLDAADVPTVEETEEGDEAEDEE